MREILFRGKAAETHEWCYGGIVHQTDFYGTEIDDYRIIDGESSEDNNIGYSTSVIHETVGQFTGLLDKNGKKVFEGDILSGRNNILHSVEFENGEFQLSTRTGQKILIAYAEDMEIIGNIYDNPELMEVESND